MSDGNGDTPDADSDEASNEARPDADGSGRGWRIAAVVAVIAAFVSLGVLGAVLFTGSSDDPAEGVRACILDPSSRDFTKSGEKDGHSKPSNCPPNGAEKTDGLVEKTTAGGFTMRRIEQGRLTDTVKLHVRKPDRPYIDIAHAQTHAALGQPIRVYTLEVDGRDSVVYMEDAPLLG